MANTILVLAANPKDTPTLRLDKEVREINAGLQRAAKKDEFILQQQWATRYKDAYRAMLDYKPNIIHFCGHGDGEDGIAFENEEGQAKLVKADVLSGLFKLFSEHVRCVVLNACYSETQANAIAQHIDYVIGMRKWIEDSIAIEFAVAFYDALGAGKEIDFAYKLACNVIEELGVSEELMPILKIKSSDEKASGKYTEKVDCIILCGGYSVRLWPLTKDNSKVLLPIAGKPTLEYVLDFVRDSSAVGKIILSVNQKYAAQIENFTLSYQSRTGLSQVELMVEPSTEQKEKLGPVGALDFIVSRQSPRNLLVLGGDNILRFRLDDFLSYARKSVHSCNALSQYPVQDDIGVYGTAKTDAGGLLTRFSEKVGSYSNISTACYYFKEKDVKAIRDYIQAGQDPDQLGGFLNWLLEERDSVISSASFPSPWFDIGTRKAILQANSHFLQPLHEGYISPDTIINGIVQIADGARILGKSILGPNVYIGRGTRVVSSNISNSIVMDGCDIQNSVIPNSLIGPNSTIELASIPDTRPVICGPKSQWKVDLD